MNNVTEKTHGLVQRWIQCKQAKKPTESELNRIQCELDNAQNELGKWLVPEGSDAKESFHIWFGSGILKADKIGQNSYVVSWRKEPDGKDRLEFGC